VHCLSIYRRGGAGIIYACAVWLGSSYSITSQFDSVKESSGLDRCDQRHMHWFARRGPACGFIWGSISVSELCRLASNIPSHDARTCIDVVKSIDNLRKKLIMEPASSAGRTS
jgi:hypothetical protein